MRKLLTLLVLGIFLTSLASAEIIINKQPKELYSMGDFVETSFKVVVTASMDIDSYFSVNFLCNGIENVVVKYPVGDLKVGEEREFSIPIPLTKKNLGRTSGTCVIKAILGDNYQLTNEFKISNLININLLSEEKEFSPGKDIIIEGEAIKENGVAANGAVVHLRAISGNSTITEVLNTVSNGYFFLNFSMPRNSKAGPYLLSIEVYELYNQEKTNRGLMDFNAVIKQIPTSLEIVFENQEVSPGKNLQVRAILHDQTGEKIDSNAVLSVKNDKNIIIEQAEKRTDEFLEFPIKYNEPPSEWIITAASNGLTAESSFKIIGKEYVEIETINKTLIITNKGNVPYNKILVVKIGEESKEINVSLGVDENQKYILSAPDGEYQIEVLGSEGSLFTGNAVLTGKSVNIKETGEIILRNPVIWIFLIIILGLTTFFIFRRIRKKSFFGFISQKKKIQPMQIIRGEETLIDTKNRAELSLSIKGSKQDANLVCLKIKNFDEVKSRKEGVKETLKKITDVAESNKAVIFENQNFLFFILAPLKTKTFRNEKTALDIAQKVKEILTQHNKLFRQRIDFGISVNKGTIVARQEETFRFMSVDNLITLAKKIASVSNEEILLSEKIKDKVSEYVKTTKQEKDNLTFYTIKEVKDAEENKKFIRAFLKRIDEKK